MNTKRMKHPLVASAMAVLAGAALQTALAQHVHLTNGTSLRLMSGTVVKLDNLNIQSGATGVLESGSEADVSSALVNGGTLTCLTGSTVNFVAGSQTLTGTTVFANLTKSGGGTLTLNSPAIVNGTLQLGSGKINVGSNNLMIGAAGSISGASSANYIVTNETGSLRRTVGGANVLFPVGPTGASYNPATVNNAGTSDVFSVRVQRTFDNPPADTNGVVRRQWTINEDVAGGSNATLIHQWTAADEGSGFIRTNPISIGHYAGTQWQTTPAAFADLGGNTFTATASGFNSFSAFAVGNDFALPVQGEQELPLTFAVHQNYPNPFNPTTTISFSLPSKLFVRLKVFDALGREVSTLLSEELSAGTYSRQWNAEGLASGVYFYRMQAGNFVETRKLLLLR